MARIGFIGTGEIAAAQVAGLQGADHQIIVSERNSAMASDLKEKFDVLIGDNQTVVDTSDIVILCLLANVARDVLPSLKFRPEQKIISVMVDVGLDVLETLCSPVTNISITIPLPNIATGGCPLPVFPDTGSVAQLFGAKNPVIPVTSQSALNAHFAATAMASVSFAQASVAANWLAQHTGDAKNAEGYVTAMMAGFFGDLANGGSLDGALAALSTEGGLNATLRQVMSDAGAEAALHAGLVAFEDRLGLALDPEG